MRGEGIARHPRPGVAVGAEHRSGRTADASADEVALAGAARADPDAFDALYRRHVGAVHRYFRVQVGSAQDAEDLTATTFSAALAGLARYQGRGSFAAWLFGIARNTLRDHRRQRRDFLDVAALDPSPPDPGPSPEEALLAAERRGALLAALRRLPDEQREALALHYFGGLRPAEIARIQGYSAGAARMRLHRAHRALRAHYGEEGH